MDQTVSSRCHNPLKVVPWFSSNEWLEVYDLICSKELKNLNYVFDVLNLWKFRVAKLPIGVEATMPLIQGYIALHSSDMENSIRNTIIATSLQRFVSVIVKSEEKKKYFQRSLHDLANEINLPHYLVDLRNEISHSNSWSGNINTIASAVDASLSWIIDFYWKPEYKQYKDGCCNELYDNEKIVKILRKFVLILQNNKGVFNTLKVQKQMNIVKKYIGYPNFLSQFIDLLLFSQDVERMIDSKKVCSCGSKIPKKLFLVVSPLVKYIIKRHGAYLLLKEILNSSWRYSKLMKEWVTLFMKPVTGSNHCKIHSLSAKFRFTIKEKKEVIMLLLDFQEEWTISLAFELFENNFYKMSFNKRKTFLTLKQIVNKLEGDDDTIEEVKKNIFTIDDLPLDSKNLAILSANKSQDVICDKEMRVWECPLGMLPHQINNKKLFMELLLDSTSGMSKIC